MTSPYGKVGLYRKARNTGADHSEALELAARARTAGFYHPNLDAVLGDPTAWYEEWRTHGGSKNWTPPLWAMEGRWGHFTRLGECWRKHGFETNELGSPYGQCMRAAWCVAYQHQPQRQLFRDVLRAYWALDALRAVPTHIVDNRSRWGNRGAKDAKRRDPQPYYRGPSVALAGDRHWRQMPDDPYAVGAMLAWVIGWAGRRYDRFQKHPSLDPATAWGEVLFVGTVVQSARDPHLEGVDSSYTWSPQGDVHGLSSVDRALLRGVVSRQPDALVDLLRDPRWLQLAGLPLRVERAYSRMRIAISESEVVTAVEGNGNGNKPPVIANRLTAGGVRETVAPNNYRAQAKRPRVEWQPLKIVSEADGNRHEVDLPEDPLVVVDFDHTGHEVVRGRLKTRITRAVFA